MRKLLIARAHDITQQIAGLAELRNQQDRVEAITTRIGQLNDVLAELRPLWDVIEALRARGRPVAIQRENAHRISTELTRLLEEVQHRPDKIAEPETLQEPMRFLKELARSTRDACRDAWLSYKSEKTVLVDQSLLAVLTDIRGFSGQVGEIRVALKSLENWTDLPRGADDIERFDLLSSRLREAWESLQGEGIPEEVVVFLRQSGMGGAPVDLLTPSVLHWIEQHDLKGHFYVGIRPVR